MNSDALIAQGYAARKEHHPEHAKLCFTEAITLSKTTNDRSALARALAGLGQIERDLHDHSAARRHYEESVAVYRTFDNPLALAHTVRHLADILRGQGDHELAEACYAEALEIYRQHENTQLLDLANTLRGYALLKTDNNEKEEALQLWREARDLYSQCNVEAGVVESDRQLALLAQQ
jgi:tetratricopeptide (TPR) repeat protein